MKHQTLNTKHFLQTITLLEVGVRERREEKKKEEKKKGINIFLNDSTNKHNNT